MASRREKLEEGARDAARDVLEGLGYLVLPPEGGEIDPEDAARAIALLWADGHLPEVSEKGAERARKYRLDAKGDEQPVWANPRELRALGTAEGAKAFREGRPPIRMSNPAHDRAAEAEHARLTALARKVST